MSIYFNGKEIGSKNDFGITNTVMSGINELKIGTDEVDDKDIQAKLEKIRRKAISGKKLSTKELEFLKKYDKELYMKVVMVQRQREALENRMANADSKEEVDRIYSEAIGTVSEKDPDYEMKINSYTDAYKEFKKTDAYNKLPATQEEAKQERNNKKKTTLGDNEKIKVVIGEYQQREIEDKKVDNFISQA